MGAGGAGGGFRGGRGGRGGRAGGGGRGGRSGGGGRGRGGGRPVKADYAAARRKFNDAYDRLGNDYMLGRISTKDYYQRTRELWQQEKAAIGYLNASSAYRAARNAGARGGPKTK